MSSTENHPKLISYDCGMENFVLMRKRCVITCWQSLRSQSWHQRLNPKSFQVFRSHSTRSHTPSPSIEHLESRESMCALCTCLRHVERCCSTGLFTSFLSWTSEMAPCFTGFGLCRHVGRGLPAAAEAWMLRCAKELLHPGSSKIREHTCLLSSPTVSGRKHTWHCRRLRPPAPSQLSEFAR